MSVHGQTKRAKEIMTALCKVLCSLTRFRVFCDIAINEWKIFDSMRKNLPQPLSGADRGKLGIEEAHYKTGLGLISGVFFDLGAVLATFEAGCISAINDGFLRRALEKLTILMPHRHRYELNNDNGNGNGNDNDDNQCLEEIAACLHLISKLGSFTKMSAGKSKSKSKYKYKYKSENRFRDKR